MVNQTVQLLGIKDSHATLVFFNSHLITLAYTSHVNTEIYPLKWPQHL